jgi:hypothetical protein
MAMMDRRAHFHRYSVNDNCWQYQSFLKNLSRFFFE